MEKDAKKIGLKISVIMAFLMSLTLSLIGNMLADRPAEMPMAPIVIGFLESFVLSFVVSLIIGFLVPVPKVNAALGRKFHLQPRTPKTSFIHSLATNLIYTPFLTTVLVTFAYFALIPAGHKPPFLPMFISSQIICFVAAQILIMVFVPIILKFVLPPKQD